MSHFQIAILGFGNVGQSLAELLLIKQTAIQERYGITFSVSGIATGHHGMAVNPAGIDLQQALQIARSRNSLDELSSEPVADVDTFLARCQAQVLFESIPVNYTNGQPALGYIRAALNLGMHVASANKGPVVHGYNELSALATAKGRKYFFEAAVMDGAPIFSQFRCALPALDLRAFRGVLNSTTNLILCRMEAGETLEEAVGYAQSIGIAETDPSGDIDGWDAAVKVAALATVLIGVPLTPAQVDRKGIRDLTLDDIRRAQKAGLRWKLVCTAEKVGDQVRARVAPEMVTSNSPMYSIDGTTSIVQFESDVLGKLSILEEDPGPHTTAYGMLADFLNAVR